MPAVGCCEWRRNGSGELERESVSAAVQQSFSATAGDGAMVAGFASAALSCKVSDAQWCGKQWRAFLVWTADCTGRPEPNIWTEPTNGSLITPGRLCRARVGWCDVRCFGIRSRSNNAEER